MITLNLISVFLVLIGVIFLAASIAISSSVHKTVPDTLRSRWRTLTGLMLFFLAGYLGFIFLQLTNVTFPLELLVGAVFMGGAVFVFLVINLSKFTISRFQNANDNLEKIVAKRTADLVRSNQDMHAEIMEREKAEADLLTAKEEAEAANRAKSEFLANMSHEIRTPMNGIIGFTEVLLGSELPRDQENHLTLIRESSARLMDLINDILDYSKIEAQKLELESIPFDLHKLLQECMKILGIKAHEKDLEVIYSIHPSVPAALIGDPGRLRQILVNLVGNAIKFTQKGEIIITASVDANAQAELPPDQVRLFFSVKDTGIGIPPEKMHLIFNSFTQGDGAITRRYGGTGLGLTISDQLSKLMGGEIQVESTEGVGSTFSFSVLLQRRHDSPLKYDKALTCELKKLKVLIVDDNKSNRQMLAEMLGAFVAHITLADSGASALDFLAEDHFDLLLIDVQMPDMDGFTLSEKIKTQPDHKNVPIIILTSSGQRGEASLSKKIGIAGYLMKPISIPELIEAIRTVIGISEASQPNPPLVTRHLLHETPKDVHLLVAEDEPINQTLARAILEQNNYQVTMVSNGQQALDALEKRDFDLILMDVQMPQMDGFEATAAIRAKEKITGCHIPIIAMTAHAMVGDREKCLAAGMDSYIAKPIEAALLLQKLAQYTS